MKLDFRRLIFGDIVTHVEVSVHIMGQHLWGYAADIPIYRVLVVWRCFGVELSGWEFEHHMQLQYPWLFPV